ncbi:MAG: hypothetical protein LBS55_09360, partial [Prevotellaceae bacterium]|nr:hypothetical protein [Prevotellaceae bacterium]
MKCFTLYRRVGNFGIIPQNDFVLIYFHSKQLSEKGKAQQSTIERDKAFDELCKWFSSFRAIARIALHDKPQLLEA